MIKTRTSRINDVSKFVRENHPYDVPEVISAKIENGSAPYLDWIGSIVPSKTSWYSTDVSVITALHTMMTIPGKTVKLLRTNWLANCKAS
ncbi:hypothetical protein LSAT2_005293 [Lamellibrachia satsuma]|nr:hypothetical protein LSAT2_005293 [Lamellibrachia satsuma]